MTDTNTDSNTRATRRILGSFGSDGTIEGLDFDVKAGDAMLFLMSVFLAVLCYEFGGVPNTAAAQYIGMGIGGGIILVTSIIIYVTPDSEKSALSWLSVILSFWRTDKERSAVDANPQNRTDTLTQVSRFHPDAGAVERTDGNIVGGVRVEPANMSLATQEEWNSAANQFGDALNTLDFDFSMHTTGRRIDGDAVVEAYDGREYDEDVQNNETLAEMVDMYKRYFRQEFRSEAHDTSVREYYILVPVSEREVQMESFGAFSKLTQLPKIGNVIKNVAGAATRMARGETQAEQTRKLAERIEDVEDAVQGGAQCSTEVLTADEMAGVIEEFWTGERSSHQDGEERMRSLPLIVSETNPAVDN